MNQINADLLSNLMCLSNYYVTYVNNVFFIRVIHIKVKLGAGKASNCSAPGGGLYNQTGRQMTKRNCTVPSTSGQGGTVPAELAHDDVCS